MARRRKRHQVTLGEALLAQRLPRLLLAMAVFTGLLVFERVEGTRLGYEASELRGRIRAVRGRAITLKIKTEERFAPDSLQRLAQRRLGMSAASPDQVVLLGPLGAGPAAPARTLLSRVYPRETR